MGRLELGSVILFCAAIIVIILHFARESNFSLHSFNFWESTWKGSIKNIVTEIKANDSPDNLFWFLHVSDIHINSEGDGEGAEHFEYFLREVVPMVDPLFVLATGDLTDAKEPGNLASKQHKAEWEMYESLLKKAGYFDRPDFWFDLRGNHDCFDVPGWNSPQNLFALHSRMKTSNYSHIFKLPFGNYGLIAIDGCPEYGPSRPFNFFGSLTTKKMDLLESQMVAFREAHVKHTIVTSHYPINTIQFQKSSSGKSIAEISEGFTAYLSGHLHRFVFGLGTHIRARRSTGFLDLEVNDIKDHRMFRVAAIDNDVFSFIDAQIDTKPIILVTNPKNAKYFVPNHEDIKTAARSTHIRVLIFSKDKVKATVKMNDSDEIPLILAKEGSPLYVASWIPGTLQSGLHSITVSATDGSGNRNSITQSFSLDGSQSKIGTFGEKLALFNLELMVKSLYWFTFLSLLALLLLPSIFSYVKFGRNGFQVKREAFIKDLHKERILMQRLTNISGFLKRLQIKMTWGLKSFAFKLLDAAHDRLIFWPFLLITLISPTSPLMVCYLGSSDTTRSFFFTWGIWRPNVGWTRLLDTWFYSTASLLIQVLPSFFLIVITCHGKDLYHYDGHSTTDLVIKSRPFHTNILCRMVMVVWWILCAFKNISLVRSQGIDVLLFGFGFSWHFIYATIMLLFPFWYNNKKSTCPKKLHTTSIEEKLK